MSIREQLQQQLGRLENAGGAFQSPELIQIDGEDFRLTCEVTGVGSLGCAVNHLTVQSEQLAGKPIEDLKVRAEHLAAKLTYLLEPIAPIEIDSDGCAVQLRSDPPHREGDERTYYELLVLRSGELSLRRFRAEHHRPREPITAHFTREVLGRLADDLVGALTD
jgi:hypothetical protein